MSDQAIRRGMFEDRVRSIDTRTPGYSEKWQTLESVILRSGGWAVVPRFEADPTIDTLIRSGKIFSGKHAVLKPGAERACHVNSCTLWRAGNASAIGTGYALSEDGLWREHSWTWSIEDQIIETTEPRTVYFGLRLQAEEAERYAEWILG